VPDVRSPTLRRRELGARLRALRQQQGLTVEQVATLLMCSPSKVSRMETGQRGATQRDIRDLCTAYGVTQEAQIASMMELAKEGKQQGWWQSYDLEDFFGTYVGLEQAASWLCYYQSSIVPGLLQTPEYARAMHRGSLPAEFTPERADALIEVRLRRQQVLTRDPPLRLETIIDEAVLHRVVGGPAVMGAQLRHLVASGNMANVTLRVIPYSVGAHPAMDNMFNILEFGNVAPRVVYVEGLMGWLFIEKERDVARYEQILELLRKIALDSKDSIDLISKIGAQYNWLLCLTSNRLNKFGLIDNFIVQHIARLTRSHRASGLKGLRCPYLRTGASCSIGVRPSAA
jgi:transcriptional regulator with XRE-family HTH domain